MHSRLWLQSVGNLLPGQRASISITYVLLSSSHAVLFVVTKCNVDGMCCSLIADLKIEGECVRYMLPTTVAPRYTPPAASDPVYASPNAQHVLNGLQLRARCDMSDTITSISSPSHPIRFALTRIHCDWALSVVHVQAEHENTELFR